MQQTMTDFDETEFIENVFLDQTQKMEHVSWVFNAEVAGREQHVELILKKYGEQAGHWR